MPEVEGTNMVKERLLTQQKVEGMDTMSIDMVLLEGKDMVEEHPSKRRLELDGKDMMEERPSKRRSEVEGMDMTSIHMVEVTTTEVERAENEPVGMCWWSIEPTREWRDIDELISIGSLGCGHWRGVEEVKPNLQVRTPVRHDVGEWRREWKSEEMCVK
jgi:hypothetical protein